MPRAKIGRSPGETAPPLMPLRPASSRRHEEHAQDGRGEQHHLDFGRSHRDSARSRAPSLLPARAPQGRSCRPCPRTMAASGKRCRRRRVDRSDRDRRGDAVRRLPRRQARRRPSIDPSDNHPGKTGQSFGTSDAGSRRRSRSDRNSPHDARPNLLLGGLKHAVRQPAGGQSPDRRWRPNASPGSGTAASLVRCGVSGRRQSIRAAPDIPSA